MRQENERNSQLKEGDRVQVNRVSGKYVVGEIVKIHPKDHTKHHKITIKLDTGEKIDVFDSQIPSWPSLMNGV